MTLFLACFFALLAAGFGAATLMYYGVVEAMLTELEVLDEENTQLMMVIGRQQEAMQSFTSPFTIH